MPRDVEIAQELATSISGATLSGPFTAEFKYDQFVNQDTVDSTTIRVSPEDLEWERGGRSNTHWLNSAVISVVMLSPAQANSNAAVDAETLITDLLDLWDGVVDQIKNFTTSIGERVLTIRSVDGRFDQEKLQNDRQFRTGVLVEFRII